MWRSRPERRTCFTPQPNSSRDSAPHPSLQFEERRDARLARTCRSRAHSLPMDGKETRNGERKPSVSRLFGWLIEQEGGITTCPPDNTGLICLHED